MRRRAPSIVAGPRSPPGGLRQKPGLLELLIRLPVSRLSTTAPRTCNRVFRRQDWAMFSPAAEMGRRDSLMGFAPSFVGVVQLCRVSALPRESPRTPPNVFSCVSSRWLSECQGKVQGIHIHCLLSARMTTGCLRAALFMPSYWDFLLSSSPIKPTAS